MTPIGIRQYNPGNIRDTPNSFRSYGSPEEGIAATMQNLIAYNDKHGINTINGMVNRWAPSSDNNNVGAYVNDVAQTAGMHPDQPYNVRDPQTLVNLATAITKHENGSVPYSPEQFNTAANMALGGNVTRSTQSLVAPPQMQAASVSSDPFAGVADNVQSQGGDPFAGVADDVHQNPMDDFARPAKALAAGAVGGLPDLLMLPGKLMSNIAPQDSAARQVPSFTGMARQQLDQWFPTSDAQSQGQRFVEGAAGFGGSMLSGGLAGRALGGAAEMLVPKTAADYAAATGGSVGAGIANAYAPDNPLVNALLPLVGGLGAGAVAGGVGVTKNAVGQIAQPFMKSGRENIVGNAYRQSAQNPQEAISALGNVPQYVPGSNPMTGAASGDYGLLSLQKTLRNQNGPVFADVESGQNTARNIMLDSMAGSKASLEEAKLARKDVTSPMRESAFGKFNNDPRLPENQYQEFKGDVQEKLSVLDGLNLATKSAQNKVKSVLSDLGYSLDETKSSSGKAVFYKATKIDPVTGDAKEINIRVGANPVPSNTKGDYIDIANPSDANKLATTLAQLEPKKSVVNPNYPIGVAGRRLASPTGNNPDVSDTMQGAVGALREANNISNPEFAYEVKKAMQAKAMNLMNARGVDPKSAKRLSGGILSDVYGSLDNQIEVAAPGYKDYLAKYSEMSKPINQMETLQDVKSEVMLSAPDARSGYDFFSQPKWSSVVQKNQDELSKVLTPEQMGNLDLITKDLDRGALVNNPAVRALGSDTQPNQSMAQFLGSVISGKTRGMSGQVLGWVAKLNEEKINRLMLEAMFDPKLAKQLMEKSTMPNVSNFAASLKRKAVQMGIYSTLNSQTMQ